MALILSHTYLKEQFKGYADKEQAALSKLIKKYENICDVLGDYQKVKLGMEITFKDWINDYKVYKMILNSIVDYVEDDIYDEECVREKWIELITKYLTAAKKLLEERRVENIENGKTKVKIYLNEKLTCDICDSIFSRVNIHRHNNTEKHKKALLTS